MCPVPMIRFPVVCPVCLGESIISRELAPIAQAIIGGIPIVLNATCHEATWIAGDTEREQIRQYIAAGVWVGSGELQVPLRLVSAKG